MFLWQLQTFPNLEKWYNNQYPSSSCSPSPKKRAKLSGKKSPSYSARPPLLILFEDLEGFGAHVLQDFILNLV